MANTRIGTTASPPSVLHTAIDTIKATRARLPLRSPFVRVRPTIKERVFTPSRRRKRIRIVRSSKTPVRRRRFIKAATSHHARGGRRHCGLCDPGLTFCRVRTDRSARCWLVLWPEP